MKALMKLILLGLVAFAVHAVQAQDTYVVLSAGEAQLKKWCDGVGGSCDDKGTGYKVLVGRNFTPNVGAELGYVDFGKFTATDNSLGFPINGEAKGRAIGGSIVGNIPFNALSLFGKAGAYYTHTELDVSALGTFVSGSGNKFVPELGVGVRFMFNKQFGIRAEFERFFDLGDFDVSGPGGTAHVDKSDVDMFSAGIEFHF